MEGTLGSSQSGFCSGRMGGPSVFVQGPAAGVPSRVAVSQEALGEGSQLCGLLQPNQGVLPLKFSWHLITVI